MSVPNGTPTATPRFGVDKAEVERVVASHVMTRVGENREDARNSDRLGVVVVDL